MDGRSRKLVRYAGYMRSKIDSAGSGTFMLETQWESGALGQKKECLTWNSAIPTAPLAMWCFRTSL